MDFDYIYIKGVEAGIEPLRYVARLVGAKNLYNLFHDVLYFDRMDYSVGSFFLLLKIHLYPKYNNTRLH